MIGSFTYDETKFFIKWYWIPFHKSHNNMDPMGFFIPECHCHLGNLLIHISGTALKTGFSFTFVYFYLSIYILLPWEGNMLLLNINFIYIYLTLDTKLILMKYSVIVVSRCFMFVCFFLSIICHTSLDLIQMTETLVSLFMLGFCKSYKRQREGPSQGLPMSILQQRFPWLLI